ncbi:MAG: nitroreductase family deazaflavin-dependent oxidoreductase [Dehalococcoidia bacterium]
MTTANDWNQSIIEEFRANEGIVGGPFAGATMLLLTHAGRKTGTERTNPLVYLDDGARILIFASKGGAPEHPDWYRNLLANPAVTIEVGTEKFGVEATEVVGAERDRLYEKNAALRPAFAQYQRNTTRKIPVIALERKG